ncbi:hypothetical protein ACWGAN_29625 [Streptomyces sp. NPDC054945]
MNGGPGVEGVSPCADPGLHPVLAAPAEPSGPAVKERLAARAGLGTGTSLRGYVRAAIGDPPHVYRRTSRAARPAPEAPTRGAGHDGVAGEVGQA